MAYETQDHWFLNAQKSPRRNECCQLPLLQRQYPEITDFYLPPEGCSYRLAVVQIKKSYPGHARRVMFGIWSFLRQFMYTKFIIVVDEDVNARDWKDVIWAITTRVDPTRDTLLADGTPIDYLDFASPVSGLGSKMGLDATNKWPGETSREWGRPMQMTPAVTARMEEVWQTLGFKGKYGHSPRGMGACCYQLSTSLGAYIRVPVWLRKALPGS